MCNYVKAFLTSTRDYFLKYAHEFVFPIDEFLLEKSNKIIYYLFTRQGALRGNHNAVGVEITIT